MVHIFFIMLFSAAILDAAQGARVSTAPSLTALAFNRVASGIQTLAELRALQEMLEPDFTPARDEALRVTLGVERFGAIRAIANRLRPLGQAIRDSVDSIIRAIDEKIRDLNQLPAGEQLLQRGNELVKDRSNSIVVRLSIPEIEPFYYLKTGQLLSPKPDGFKFGYSLADIASAGQEIAQHFVKGDAVGRNVDIVMRVPANVRSHAAISSAHGLEEILRVMNIVPATIRRLNISGNRITALPPGVFAGLSNLQVLVLSGNRITTLPAGIFAGLSNLHWLDLEANQITALPAGIFAGLSNLQTLNLFGNRIAALPEGVFAGLSNLLILHLPGNPITIPDRVADLRLSEMRARYPRLFSRPVFRTQGQHVGLAGALDENHPRVRR